MTTRRPRLPASLGRPEHDRPRPQGDPGTIAFSAADALTTTFQVPQDATDGQTIHALIQVTDNGAPPLTSFQRVVVTVKTR